MLKGMLATAVSISLLALSGCSSENDAEKASQSTATTVANVTEKATQSAEQAVAATNIAIIESKAAVENVMAPGTAEAGAQDTTAVVTGIVSDTENESELKILKDENGNIIITQELIDARTQSSRTAVKAFGGALKAELTAAIKEGGTVNAISVCNTRAPEIATQVSTDKEVSLSRVSLKNRNPSGAPQDWQIGVLEDFEARKANGEVAATLEYTEVIELGGEHTLRYMKAIEADKEVCMACHGSNIEEAVQIKLNELYPNDKATGYSLGDLRGAFVVTQPM